MKDEDIEILALVENEKGWEHLYYINNVLPKKPFPSLFERDVNAWVRGFKFCLKWQENQKNKVSGINSKSQAMKTPENFIQYITECNLATVSGMALIKTRKKSEYERQISIAQSCIDFMKSNNLPVQIDSRAYKVLATESQSVKEWAEQFEC